MNTGSAAQMTARFVNETNNTTLLPSQRVSETNREKAAQAEKVAVSAQGRRSAACKSGPSTLTDVEELIGALVSATPGNGYLPLLPHTTTALYYKAGTSTSHVNMLKESAVLGTRQSETAASSSEQWRRFIGRQLMLLTWLPASRFSLLTTRQSSTLLANARREVL
jgi:hypothetical protein